MPQDACRRNSLIAPHILPDRRTSDRGPLDTSRPGGITCRSTHNTSNPGERGMTTVLFGNSAPQMQVTQPDGTTISVPAGHINQSETRVDMWEGFDDPDENELALSTSNDRHLSLIGRQLDASEHPTNYAIGINEVE